jgi:hypothetical protein
MKPRFEVHCDAIGSTFALARGEEGWRQYFTDLRDVLDYATEIATEETPITIYNELGCVIVESIIAPKRAAEPSRQNVSIRAGTNRMTNTAEQFQEDGGPDQRPLPPSAPKPSYDAIALKAYFIALDRHARGEPGDPLKDWIEAENQLRAVAGKSSAA